MTRGAGRKLTVLLAVTLPGLGLPAQGQCPGEGDCCSANGTPGCDDLVCCVEVCVTDPFCCDVQWDSICASVANETCAACGAGCPGTGNCCEANGTPGCDDFFCCALVCAGDPFCCDTAWDSTCALQAAGACSICSTGCPGGGDCCVNNGTPGCNDEACCELICESDPFCCDSFWDGVCAGQAQELCDVCQPVCADPVLDLEGTVITPPETVPGGGLTVLYLVVNTGECTEILLLDASIQLASGGDVFTSPECDTVVSIGPGATRLFERCFDVPDPIAPGLYEVCYEIRDPKIGSVIDGFCRDDLTVRTQGDLDGDGEVGMIDFLALLELWGPCESCADCPGDFDGDCKVGMTDLLILIANWG